MCYAWMSISLDAAIGTDQTKDTFLSQIEEYYRKTVKVDSNQTKCSLTHRWSTIQDCCNRWSGCGEQMDRIPPSGVPLNYHETYIQALYKSRNKRNDEKCFPLHHCWLFSKEMRSGRGGIGRQYHRTQAHRIVCQDPNIREVHLGRVHLCRLLQTE